MCVCAFLFGWLVGVWVWVFFYNCLVINKIKQTVALLSLPECVAHMSLLYSFYTVYLKRIVE